MDTNSCIACILGVLCHKVLQMKKIILSLMLLTSFAFSQNYAISPGPVSVGQVIFLGNHYRIVTDSAYTTKDAFINGNTFTPAKDDEWLYHSSDFSIRHVTYRKTQEIHWLKDEKAYYTNWYASVGGQCPSGTTLNSHGVCSSEPELPQCGEGTYLNPATLSCAPTYPIADEETLESGSKNVIFEDGAMMIVNPDGTAVTFAPDGAKIPNRLYNGSIPEVGYLSEFKNVGIGDSNFFTVNPLGIFLKSSAEFVIGNTALLWTKWLSDGKQTANNDVVEFRPVSNSPTAVNISSVNFDNIDFSEYENKSSSTPQTVPNTNMSYQKVTPENSQQFPSAYEGDTVFYKNNDTSNFVASNSSAVAVVKANPDGSSQKLEISKNDLQNTANHNTDLPVKQTITPAPKINADGTTTQIPEITQATVAPNTNNSTNTNSTTGTPIIAPYGKGDPNTKAPISPNPSGTGSNIDLGGVTSRLDRISNQLTKINNRNDEIDKAVVADVQHGIPSVPAEWDTWQTTWNNLRTDLDNVVTKADELKSLIEGEPLTLNLARGGVQSCPHTYSFDLNGRNVQGSFDLCQVLAPARLAMYSIFYLVFVGTTLFFSVKILFRLV